ncbi:hypothetical protein [Nocardioides sp.]|uniref:hypothetical protein n=1 Tax=Nocardioides sp. TaxID=35761 RepID=UPI0037830EA6
MSTNEPPPEEPTAGGTPPPPPPPPPSYGQPAAPTEGGYGGGEAPPPPPAPPGGAGGYPPPPPTPGTQWSLGEALSYGWNKFTANAGQILLAVLVLVLVYAAASALAFGFIALMTSGASCDFNNSTGSLECDNGSSFFWRMIVSGVAYGFLFVVGQIVAAGIIRGALGITEGRPFQMSEFFKTDQLGAVVVASLLVGIATGIGYMLCYLPGIVVAFVTSYTLFFVLDQKLAPVDAIKASFEFIKNNLGNTILWYIVGGLVAAAGAIACIVGLVVTVPLVIIGTAYTYKKLSNQPVAA